MSYFGGRQGVEKITDPATPVKGKKDEVVLWGGLLQLASPALILAIDQNVNREQGRHDLR